MLSHSALQGRIQRLEEERVSSASELAARREELVAQARDLAQLREAHAVLEAKLAVKEGELQGCKEAAVQLEVERELRARCEIREEAERTERIAASSQLLATQSECANRIREVEEKKNAEAAALQECVTQLNQERNELREQCRLEADKAAGLQTELQHLHNELEHASANHEAIEQLSKATGELEVMRRRNKELAESLEASGTMEARRVAEYEEKILAGEAQRRRLHNLIQELRGNVRVFARVRPFLPNDGVDMTSLPSPSIAVRSDINSLRIARAALGPDGRSEEHSFQFDKVFGPSSSQEAVFQEVAEFVQSALDGYNVCLFSYGKYISALIFSVICDVCIISITPSCTLVFNFRANRLRENALDAGFWKWFNAWRDSSRNGAGGAVQERAGVERLVLLHGGVLH